jgi:hypothetical protein
MVCYRNISNNSEDTWKSGLEIYDDEQTIFSLGSSVDIHSQYQVYATIEETSEEYDANNNPIINPGDVRRGANHMVEGDTEETIAARVSVGDIPNGYTSDVVLNQQARVAHWGGMADCLPGGKVARETMVVLDAGAYGRSTDRPMAGCLVVHA